MKYPLYSLLPRYLIKLMASIIQGMYIKLCISSPGNVAIKDLDYEMANKTNVSYGWLQRYKTNMEKSINKM